MQPLPRMIAAGAGALERYLREAVVTDAGIPTDAETVSRVILEAALATEDDETIACALNDRPSLR